MNQLYRLWIGFVFAMCLCMTAGNGFQQVYAVDINSYVTDNAGIFDASQRLLIENALERIYKSTNGVQVVVYTDSVVPADYSLDEYSLKIAEDNEIGKEGADNGILFYIAIDDKKYRWEIGYGVEDVLNTPLLGRISRTYMEPHFQRGDYSEGIIKGMDVVEKIIMNSSDEDVAAVMVEQTDISGSVPRTVLGRIIPWIFLFGVLFLISALRGTSKDRGNKKKGSYSNLIYIAAASALLRGGGGGFGGGGFGGGGGGFGGGGFSGGW